MDRMGDEADAGGFKTGLTSFRAFPAAGQRAFSSSGTAIHLGTVPREASLNVRGWMRVDPSIQGPVLLSRPAWHCQKMAPCDISRNS